MIHLLHDHAFAFPPGWSGTPLGLGASRCCGSAAGNHVWAARTSGPAFRRPRGGEGPRRRNVAAMGYAVAASSQWTDADGVRRPAGEVHAWTPGTNQTLCGLALSRSH